MTGKAALVARQSGAREDVRLSQSAVDAMNELPEPQIPAVADAIKRIGAKPGERLRFTPPGVPDEHLEAMVPVSDAAAPVVVYRRLTKEEGKGYLVAALVDRAAYQDYERAERDGTFDSRSGKLGLAAVTDAVAATVHAPRG
jgi:hypothetical protein